MVTFGGGVDDDDDDEDKEVGDDDGDGDDGELDGETPMPAAADPALSHLSVIGLSFLSPSLACVDDDPPLPLVSSNVASLPGLIPEPSRFETSPVCPVLSGFEGGAKFSVVAFFLFLC